VDDSDSAATPPKRRLFGRRSNPKDEGGPT
jgi:hypothetical protein